MKKTVLGMLLGSLIVLIVFVFPAYSQKEEGVEVKDAPKIDPESMADFIESLEFLSKAGSFSFSAEAEYDALQGNGQKMEFGGVHKITVVRPDKVYSEIKERDGTEKSFIFDGKDIYYADLEQNVYASVPRPGNIDQAMDYFTEGLQMPLPLGQLISSDIAEMVKKEIYAGGFVDESTIGGVECDHLAFRMKNIDIQVWIASEGDPLQMRLVIDYKNAPGEPQFRAMFRDWNFKPAASDSLFVFKPGDGMKKITFAPILRAGLKSEEKEAEKK
ncbi:MAG: DUF2092 domain-containing protein [Thermodesulfobacteriota bacterium]